jgi:hypothetical protein
MPCSVSRPARKAEPSIVPQVILDAFPAAPLEVLKSRDYLLVNDTAVLQERR